VLRLGFTLCLNLLVSALSEPRSLIAFPAAWPQHRRHAFTLDAAVTAASELTTLLDDHLDTPTDSSHRTP
jgi:hypothetical protein